MTAAVSRIRKATSNTDFGNRVGIHYTFASRLRNGQRIPSLDTLNRIIEAFELNESEAAAITHSARSAPEFGTWISEHLFEESTSALLGPRR